MDFDEPMYRAFLKNLNRDFLSYDKEFTYHHLDLKQIILLKKFTII